MMRPAHLRDEAHRIAFGFSPPDEPYFATRLRDGLGERGHTPRRSRAERQQRAWQAAEEIGFGTCRGERKANAAGGLDDPGGDFQETTSQRRELGSGQFPGFGNGVAHTNKRRCGERGGLDWRAPNGSWCDRRRAVSYAA